MELNFISLSERDHSVKHGSFTVVSDYTRLHGPYVCHSLENRSHMGEHVASGGEQQGAPVGACQNTTAAAAQKATINVASMRESVPWK